MPMIFDRWIRFIEEAVCTVSLAIIVTLVIVQVFYRYVLSSGILWLNEVVTNLMVLMVMFGAALATRNKVHTDLKILVRKSPNIISLALRIIGIAVTGLFLLILIYYSALHAYNSRMLTTIMTDIPLWVAYGIIPVGAVLVFYEFVKMVPAILGPIQEISDEE